MYKNKSATCVHIYASVCLCVYVSMCLCVYVSSSYKKNKSFELLYIQYWYRTVKTKKRLVMKRATIVNDSRLERRVDQNGYGWNGMSATSKITVRYIGDRFEVSLLFLGRRCI